MGNTYAISALIKRRAELAWRQYEAGKLYRSIGKELSELDRMLINLGYEHDPMRIAKRRKNNPPMFKRGRLRRMIFDILREGPCLTTNEEYAVAVMKRINWDTTNGSLVHAVSLKVRSVRKIIAR